LKNILIILLSFLSLNFFSTEIKFAALAPEGSTWFKLMRKLDDELKKETKGKLSFKLFPGGISGDELDVIRKIKFRKIHSAGFTGVGLGQILPEVRILELPRLFETHEESDYVVKKITPYFKKKFKSKGYVFLGWAEVGFVNIFSNKEIKKISDLKGLKMWAWKGDPLVKALFKDLKIVPNEMPITNVFTSLETGLIDSIYISPLAAIALQWFTKVKYMNRLKLTNATGAILITEKKFKKLKKEHQKLLKEKFKKLSKDLISESRKDNKEAYKTLEKNKIKFVSMKEDEIKKFDKISKKVWEKLSKGEEKLYSKDLLNKILKYKKEFKIKKEKEKEKKKTENEK
jgi:TRAP-type transport system periplasmic protein